MIKLGMPILYEFDNLEDNFKLAEELNLDFIELNLNFSYCRKGIEDGTLKKLINKYKLLTTLHFYDEADMGSYPEVVNVYLNLLEKYASLSKGLVEKVNMHNNCGPIVTISGKKNYIYQKEYNDYIERILSNFNKAKDILDHYGIELVIENIDNAKGATFLMDNFINLNKAGFNFTFDIGHDYVDGSLFYDLIKNNNLKLAEFHFHDSDGRRCHLALGEGNMDLKYYYNLSKANDSFVLLEVKSSSDLKRSVDYFRKLSNN